MDRPLPDLRRHWKRRSDDAAVEVGLEAFFWGDVADSIWVAVAAVLLALIVLVALPPSGSHSSWFSLLALLSL